mgnify:FL=1
MKRVVIAGAGGLGREVFRWLCDGPQCGKAWDVAGYLDDDPLAAQRPLPAPLLGTISSFQPQPDDRVVLALGNPRPRKAVAESLAARGARWLTYAHPTVIIGDRVELGEGCFLCPGSILTCDITIGPCTFFNLGVTIGHDVTVGAFSSVFSQVDLCGYVTLGEGVTVGSGARVIPGKTVGAWATIGAGAVVVGNVPAGITAIGNPARRLR